MLTIREYKLAEDLKQAYELNQKRSNRIIGGMMWQKMSSGAIATAIDLSGLGLNRIEEKEDRFFIGAMCTLRQMEQHAGLEAAFDGALGQALRHIVGVQFRNTATVGGSVYGRFGFSDVTACLLALDTWVDLYPSGWMPLEQFMQAPYGNEILVRVCIKKDSWNIVYKSYRRASTDLPVVTCGVSEKDGVWRASIGARPGKAVLQTAKAPVPVGKAESDALAETLCGQVSFGGNMRGSGEYRAHIARVLASRAIQEIVGRKGE